MRVKTYLLALGFVVLSACGGGGSDGGTADSGVGVNPPPPTLPVQGGNKIFIGDIGNEVLAAVDTLTPKPGALSAKIFTSDTSLWSDAAFDGTRDELYVANKNRIDVYAGASKLDGAIKPARTISPAVSGLLFVQRVVLDKANDRLYIGMKAAFNGSVAVFEQASKLSGAVTPSRIISGNLYGGSFVIDLKRNVLYDMVSGLPTTAIFAFDHIDTVNGDVTAARRLIVTGSAYGMAIDSSRDRLYINAGAGKIAIVDGVSSAAGQTAVTTLSVPATAVGSAITIDALNDRLYAGYGNTAIVLNDASKLTNANSAAQAVAVTASPTTAFSFFAVPQ